MHPTQRMTDKTMPMIDDALSFPPVSKIKADDTFTMNIMGLINAEHATTRNMPTTRTTRHPMMRVV